jgi:hypothetical protein
MKFVQEISTPPWKLVLFTSQLNEHLRDPGPRTRRNQGFDGVAVGHPARPFSM